MRIDFVITELFPGGAERCLTELAIACQATGDDVRVFSIGSLPSGSSSTSGGSSTSGSSSTSGRGTSSDSSTSGGDAAVLVHRLAAAGVDVQTAGVDSPFQYVAAMRALRRWMADRPPQVCQTFLYHANVIGTLAAARCNVPLRVGGLRVAEPNWVRCKIERYAARRMHAMACVSGQLQTFASEHLGVETRHSVVIPNAVDVGRFAHGPRFDWTSIHWPRDAIVTLFVGRMHSQKGIDLLQSEIDAIAPAGTNQKLMLVGDGPLSSSIDTWIRDIGRDRVQRLGWQSDVAPLMRAARVLVLPSRYEGMPNVVMEAMAAGRAVVSARVEGAAELLGSVAFRTTTAASPHPNFAEPKATFWDAQTFEIGDHRTMAARIETFIQHADVADQCGRVNQQRMRNDFSVAAMVDAYRGLYRSLLRRRLDDDSTRDKSLGERSWSTS